MLDFENNGLACFSVECVIWTNSILTALAQRAFPKDPNAGGRTLDITLATLAHKLTLAEQSKTLSIRIEQGFELAVFKVLLDSGLPLPNHLVSFDPGGAIIAPAATAA